MATEPKIIRSLRKVLATYDITLVSWEYTGSTNMRVNVERNGVNIHSVISHSQTEVKREVISSIKRALNAAEQK